MNNFSLKKFECCFTIYTKCYLLTKTKLLKKKSIILYLFSLEKSVGIPEFWLQVFKNSDVLSELIKVLKTNDIPQINFNLGTR